MEVFKFGGTSVGTADRIRSAAGIVAGGRDRIVVLSANGNITDRLVEIVRLMESGNTEEAYAVLRGVDHFYSSLSGELLARPYTRQKADHALHEMISAIASCFGQAPDPFMTNWIVTRGEMISTILFSLYLEEQAVDHAFMHASDIVRVDRDGQADLAYIRESLAHFLEKEGAGRLIVTQGFICTDEQGRTETLGRGGSDLSASLLGAACDASVIQIWSDVDGFLNNDPGYVRGALPLSHLSFDEAAELAYFGARILHPSTINPARVAGIPVLLKNTLRPEAPGTVISTQQLSGQLKAVAAKDNIWVVNIQSNRMLMAYGFLRRVFEIFERHRTPVDMVTTSEVSVSVTIDNPSQLEEIMHELKALGEVSASNGYSIVCVVGDNLAGQRGNVRQLFSVLEGIPIRMISYGAAKNSISLLVETVAKSETLESLNTLLTEIHQNHESYV